VRNFDFTSFLPEHESYVVRSVPGVARAEALVVGPARWQLPQGGVESVQVVGLETQAELLRPWSVGDGDPESIHHDRDVLIDADDCRKLGCRGIGDSTEIYVSPRNGTEARVVGLSQQMRTFQGIPIVLTGAKNARAFCALSEGTFSFLLARTAAG
jgi:hypothetical protein